VTALAYDDVTEGAELPEFALPLTLQRLVMEAAANRDFTPIHHDRELSRATGAPDPYANTMLIQAVFEATLREWMGLAGRLRRLRFNMRSFAAAGSIMSGHGRVTGKRAGDDGDGGFVDVDVWTASGGAQTATGTATIWLPYGGCAP
jgi:3-oxo-4,17-pregnadiene-20-carboxyl-CoA hydratase beta subunit